MNIDQLTSRILQTHDIFYTRTISTINTSITVRNWLIGAYIVEYEQKGDDRAKYGEQVISRLESSFSDKDVKGFSATYLKIYRQFYLTYPSLTPTVKGFIEENRIGQTASDLFEMDGNRIGQTASDLFKTMLDDTLDTRSEGEEKVASCRSEILTKLSFSHLVELVKITELDKRQFYETSVMIHTWSVKELKRQIASLFFERSEMSIDPYKLEKSMRNSTEQNNAASFLKSPFVFEFLDLPHREIVEETDLEQALIDNLQGFLLELGNGFCFEARQKRILIGSEYYFIDLVFYHRLLKCHVLVELKVGEFSHQNIGQLNTYVNYYHKNFTDESDNPPIGILLCTAKNDALVEYALGSMTEKLFVSDYLLKLPEPEKLKRAILGKANDSKS